MVANGNKGGGGGVSAAPPSDLHVWKFAESRAPEIEGLHSIIADRLGNNFQSQRNKRRRTAGYDNRVARKKFRKRSNDGFGQAGKVDSMKKDEKKVSRRVRRGVELKKNPPTGYCTSGDGTKRLRTHVWHAKRFTMEKHWGFYIPLGLHGRGRGSRALLKKLRSGVLVHDASYYGAIQLEGPQERLMSVLNSVLVPSPTAGCEETLHDILMGNVFGAAMLHDADKVSFRPIAPVTYMWRPMQQLSSNMEGLSREAASGEQNIDKTTFIRHLWLWVHAASFKEAYDSLSSACEKNTDGNCSARCISREGQLAKLELIGSKVYQLLHKTLQPVKLNSEKSWHVKKCSAHEHDGPVGSENMSFENGHQISSSALLSLVVKDPRELTKNGDVVVPDAKQLGLIGNEEMQSKEQTVSSLPKHEAEAESEHEYGDLWDASKVVDPPVEESVLCAAKHQQRKEFFGIGHKGSGSQNATAGSCPVLLLKNGTFDDSITRCSLILPLNWVKAFWITFVLNGAHAIGLREKHWVTSEIGLPYFPLDFPDCNAYSDFMEKEAATVNDKDMLVPPSKRPLKVPIPPPWDCVLNSFPNNSSEAENIQVDTLGTQDEEIGDMEKNSCSEISHDRISECRVTPFKGIVARTSCMLNNFLNNISGNHLLFPSLPGQGSSLNKFMRNKDFLKQDNTISDMNCGKTPCFVRILLHAFKEGVFEQGAVVCAPLATDVKLWTSSSESNDQQLQIPQSSVISYFKQLPSGKWELQISKDRELSVSHRLPIGFVTTGFVRGSKKATAGALCEASLLSRLREEQWKAVPAKRRRKEIYVLVRNMRSTAYRLARATIVLEQQEQDANFM